MPKYNLSVILSALVLLASLAYGYGILTQKVDTISVAQQEMKVQLTDISRKLELYIGVK